ncbi:hypothetical protein P4538_06810, partial [Geobacillus stearothermophilus]|nr:hypothetical protein [Geobacillus stearothermophilus]
AGNHQKKGCMDHISIELTPKSKLISNHHGFRFYIILPMNAKMENRKIDQETAGKTLRGGGFLLK